MDKNVLKQKICSTWKLPAELDKAKGSIIALDSESGDLHFNTYLINDKFFSKLWQYQFGYDLNVDYSPTTIQYWKYINDCSFDSLNWTSPKQLPKNDEEIICWINYSCYNSRFETIQNNRDGHVPLQYLSTRIHIGLFKKGFFGNKLHSLINHFNDVPWAAIFKWMSLDDFFKLNEDPRKFTIDPNRSFSLDWLHKKK